MIGNILVKTNKSLKTFEIKRVYINEHNEPHIEVVGGSLRALVGKDDCLLIFRPSEVLAEMFSVNPKGIALRSYDRMSEWLVNEVCLVGDVE